MLDVQPRLPLLKGMHSCHQGQVEYILTEKRKDTNPTNVRYDICLHIINMDLSCR